MIFLWPLQNLWLFVCWLCRQRAARRDALLARRAARQALQHPVDLCWSCDSRPTNESSSIFCDECCPPRLKEPS